MTRLNTMRVPRPTPGGNAREANQWQLEDNERKTAELDVAKKAIDEQIASYNVQRKSTKKLIETRDELRQKANSLYFEKIEVEKKLNNFTK